MKPIKIFAIAAAALLLAGCRGNRDAVKPATPSASEEVTVENPLLKQKFTDLIGSYSDWDDVKIPVTLDLDSPANVRISGNLTMKRNRSIHLSMKMLGMEILSAFVTPDSVFASFKPSKIYLAESTQNLLCGFPVTVGNVQNLLLGRVFCAGDDAVKAGAALLAPESGNGYSVSFPIKAPVDYRFDIDAKNVVEDLQVTPKGMAPVVCDYSTPVSTVSGPVATGLGLDVKAGKTRIAGVLELNPKKAKWNQGEEPRWKRPKGYRRVKPSEIGGMLKF